MAGVIAAGVRRFAAARLAWLAVDVAELIVLLRVFPDERLAVALGLVSACRLVGAIAGELPARPAAAAALVTLGACLAVLRLRGGPAGGLEIYALLCCGRLALELAGRLGSPRAGLAPGACLVLLLLAAGAAPRTLVVVHLLGASLPVLLGARRRREVDRRGDLSVTALYTNGTWSWGGLPGAELLASREAKAAFDATNLVLSITGLVASGPSLRCSLLQRHLMIDHLYAESGAEHVLELAAGLSRRGVAMSADARVSYTEVDRAPVIAHKRRLLARSEAGRAVLLRPNLRLVAADLTDASLHELVTAPAGAPLFVIAEGLLMYLDAAAQRSLWRRVRALFDVRPGVMVFDLVPLVEHPRPGRASRALRWLFRRATRGARFERDARTRDDISAELRDLGFTVELYEPRAVLERWQLPHGDVRTQQLLFVCKVPR